MLSTSATFQRTRTDWKVESCWLSQAAASRQSSPKPAAGRGNAARFRPLIEALVTGCIPRHSAFCGRGGWGSPDGGVVSGRVSGALSPREGSRQLGAGEGRARAGRKVLGGAAGGAETPVQLQEPRPSPAAAPALPTPGGSPPPLPAPAVRAMAPRKNAKGGGGNSSSSSSGSPTGCTSGGSSSPGARRGQRRSGAGVRVARRMGLRCGGGVGSAGPPPQIPPSASSILLRARGGGRARWAWWVGWRGAGPSGEPLPGRSLTCSAQPRWRLCRSTPSWLAVELTIGVRETVYLGCAYFGEFGNEPKSENKFVPNQQLLSAAQRRIRLLGCVCGTGERGVI